MRAPVAKKRKNNPADAAEMRAGNGRARPAKRVRYHPVDGRTRSARRWRAAFEDAMRRAGNRSEQLARAYASATVARQALDEALARGECVDVALLIKLSGEVRRLSARLDLADEPAAVAADAPAWLVGPRRQEAAP